MKFYAFSFLLLLFPFLAQSQVLVNDANAETRNITEAFREISVSDGISLYLSQSSKPAVAVSASESQHRDRIVTQVVNGKLLIYFDRKGPVFNGKKNLKAYVSFTDLTMLKANAGAHVRLTEKATLKEIELDFSSGAHGDMFFDAAKADVDLSSGAQLDLKGTSTAIRVEASSGALLKGYELVVTQAEAKASSGAGIRLKITGELIAKATSGGAIRYQGTPVMKEVDVNSGGVIKRAD